MCRDAPVNLVLIRQAGTWSGINVIGNQFDQVHRNIHCIIHLRIAPDVPL